LKIKARSASELDEFFWVDSLEFTFTNSCRFVFVAPMVRAFIEEAYVDLCVARLDRNFDTRPEGVSIFVNLSLVVLLQVFINTNIVANIMVILCFMI
jgi:hypothetical protein